MESAMRYFDYNPVARQAGIPDEKLATLCQWLRREFPADDMLYELHVLRACMAIRDGLTSLEEVLAAESQAAA